MRVGVDIMGGDFAPKSVLDGAALYIKESTDKNSQLVLIGDQEIIKNGMNECDVPSDAYEIVHAPETIEMAESPIKAFTSKPKSSIGVGLGLLAGKKIDAFSSAGNTGAMLVGAMYTVKSIPGVIRPCITTMLPKENGDVGVILDVGANADCKPDVLYQFGILGSIYAENIYNVKDPKVGLMSLGEEEGKGNLVSQAAYEIMKNSNQLHFAGNVEGRDLFNEKADVVVCDGYVGNVIIKMAESIYEITHKYDTRNKLIDRFNYEIYGGSPILGVNGAIVVGHGNSSPLAIKNMINLSKNVAETKIAEKVAKIFAYNEV